MHHRAIQLELRKKLHAHAQKELLLAPPSHSCPLQKKTSDPVTASRNILWPRDHEQNSLCHCDRSVTPVAAECIARMGVTTPWRQEGSSRPSMASSVIRTINRTRCIWTSVNYNILLVYRNQPKLNATGLVVFLQTVVFYWPALHLP